MASGRRLMIGLVPFACAGLLRRTPDAPVSASGASVDCYAAAGVGVGGVS